MLEKIRKGLLASLGAAVVTREKVEEVTAKLVADGKLNREEAKRLGDQLVDSGKRQWADLEKGVTETVQKGLGNLKMVKEADFEELQEKVNKLEKQLASLRRKLNKALKDMA